MSSTSTKLDDTSSTNSVILIGVKQAPRAFVELIRQEMDARNWGIRDTAGKVGVSHPTISDIVTNGKQPSFETVLALAGTFEKPAVFMLRLSGLLPPEPEYVPLLDEWNDVFYDLTEDDRQELLEIARLKTSRTRAKQAAQPQAKKQSSRGKNPARNALKDQ